MNKLDYLLKIKLLKIDNKYLKKEIKILKEYINKIDKINGLSGGSKS